jgi:type I restriction enzyme S subunit
MAKKKRERQSASQAPARHSGEGRNPELAPNLPEPSEGDAANESAIGMVPLKRVSSKIADGSHNPPPKQASGVPMLSARNISEVGIAFDDFRFITREAFELERKRVDLLPGDVLLTIVGSIGRAAVVPESSRQFAIQRSVAMIRPRGLDSKFCMYQLRSDRVPKWLREHARGSAQQGVYLKTLANLPMLVVPLAMQHQIVAEIEKQFTRLDAGVAALRRVQANLKRYRAAVLKAACEGRLVPQRGDWAELPLKKLIGKIGQGWSPKCDTSRDAALGEWAVITTTAVQSMKYVDGQGKPLPSDLEPRPHLEIRPGDFLMTRKGPRKRAGVTCLVHATMPHLMVCDTVYRFRCDESLVEPRYLEVALNSPDVAKAIDRQKAGISESGVSLTHDKLGIVPIPVPSLIEQREIVAEVERRLSVIEELEAAATANLQRATRLRQAILRCAFSEISEARG